MSGRGGDELTSLLRTDNIQRDNIQREYTRFLRIVLVIFFLVVVASVVAIVVLWINKPPKPVVCDDLSSNASGFMSVFSDYPVEPIRFLTKGNIYTFSFQALGNHNLQVNYRLCNQILYGNTSNVVCRNYTRTGMIIEDTFADVFTAVNCSQSSVLTLEFLQFQPKPAILMWCAASSADNYQSFCIAGNGGGNSVGTVEDEEENPVGWWGSYIANDTQQTFQAAYTTFGVNSTKELGFCGQTFRQRKLPDVKYSTCWDTGILNDTCVPGITGEKKDSDFFNGVYTYNSTIFTRRRSNSDDLYHFYININGTKTGMYVAAIGERPYIDSICNLK